MAMLEHLRVEKIPDRYILRRYTKDANSDTSFNRRDYRSTTPDGTLIQYRRTMLLNETLKTVNKGVKTDAAYNRLMECLKQVQPELDTLNGDDVESNCKEQASDVVDGCMPGMFAQKEAKIEKGNIHDDQRKIHPHPSRKQKVGAKQLLQRRMRRIR